MPLAAAVAGPYTGTYDASSVGITRDGFELQQNYNKELITSDFYGESVIDAVWRGGQTFLTFEGIEYGAAVAVLTDYNFATHIQAGKTDVGSSLHATTTLTAVAGTTASLVPAALSSTHSIVSETSETRLAFAARLRTVPVTLRLYPYNSSGTIIWFATT